MIKGHMRTASGRDIILLGISENNVEILKAGNPLVIMRQDLPPYLLQDIIIIFGETEQAIVDQLRAQGYITDETIQIPTPTPTRQ